MERPGWLHRVLCPAELKLILTDADLLDRLLRFLCQSKLLFIFLIFRLSCVIKLIIYQGFRQHFTWTKTTSLLSHIDKLSFLTLAAIGLKAIYFQFFALTCPLNRPDAATGNISSVDRAINLATFLLFARFPLNGNWFLFDRISLRALCSVTGVLLITTLKEIAFFMLVGGGQDWRVFSLPPDNDLGIVTVCRSISILNLL